MNIGVRPFIVAGILLGVCWGTFAQSRAPGVPSAAAAPAGEFRPVTDEMLRNPAASDWLHWRRNYDGSGYSPLDQINRQTVGQLQLAWAWGMEPGSQETTPLVYGGVMYLAHPDNVIQALDAAKGDLLWEYRREFRQAAPNAPAAGGAPPIPRGRPLRSLAIYEDKVFVNTADAHIVALDARTGKVVWETRVAERLSFQTGGLVVRGKLISGLQSCARYTNEKCAITAHDTKTGRELWRTVTLAQPGQPGSETWGDVPPLFRAGGDLWITGSYDPELDLIYWGVTQAKPWASFNRGNAGDALYSNSTLALNPDTGKMVWYYQHIPGDTMDMDDNFENVLVDRGGRKSLFKMGKVGILWQLDRVTGKLVSAVDLGYQRVVTLDRKRGQAIPRADLMPKPNQVLEMCPTIDGMKSWRAMAYSPQTHAFYIPLALACEKGAFLHVEPVEGGGGGGFSRKELFHHPESGGNVGEFVAMDAATGRVLWRHRQRAIFNTAALTTAGGLVFVGDLNRHINAYDVSTGELLWQTRGVTTSPQGFPITYAVGGKQYLAVPVGVGAQGWANSIPRALTPEIKRPSAGNAVFVYTLPDKK